MNKPFLQTLLVSSLASFLFLSGCSARASQKEIPAITAAAPQTDLPASAAPPQPVAAAAAKAGYPVAVPDESLLEGDVLDGVEVDDATQSVCLKYHHPAPGGDSLLFIAQGPLDFAPALEKIPDGRNTCSNSRR